MEQILINFSLQHSKKEMPNSKYFSNFSHKFLILIIFSTLLVNIKSSLINLIISGSGAQNILSSTFTVDPSEVIVNGISKGNTCQNTCELDSEENNVTLIFDSAITTCENMFSGLENIKEIDLSEFDSSNVITMSRMFYDCQNLKKINLGNIDTSKVEEMNFMFGNCYNLTFIDLSNLKTPKLNNMASMFRECWSLSEINFGNFNTSSVGDMRAMFYYCKNLTSVDLSSFDTSIVTHMGSMFSHCQSLKSIDISNFDFSKIKSIYSMFSHCHELMTINLTSLTPNAKNYSYLFKNCRNLRYVNLPNFSPTEVNSIKEMFNGCDSLIYLNLKSLKLFANDSLEKNEIFNDDISNLKICVEDTETRQVLFQNNSKGGDCTDKCFYENIKIDINSNECIESCITNNYDFEYNNICYNECPENTHISSYNSGLCEDDKCKYFYKDRDQCQEIEGYYLDEKDGKYKKCFKNCKYCYGPGNEEKNNCIECINNFTFLNEFFYETNCFPKCEYYYYFDETNKYNCTLNEDCPEQYNKLVSHKNKCIDQCINDNIYKFELNNICYESNPIETTYLKEETNANTNTNENTNHKEETYSDEDTNINEKNENTFNNQISNKIQENSYSETEVQDTILEKIIEQILMNEFNSTEIEAGKDYIHTEGSVTYTITTTSNQKNNKNNNVTKIDLGKCEEKLKQKYKINFNNSLYILKIDAYFEGYNFPKVEYDVYYPLNGTNLTKLDLSICENEKITISIPINISTSDIDKYNSSSGLYNDLCYTLKTETGTDKCLKDRQEEYNSNINNLSICEEGCEFSEYDEITKTASCSCFTKIKLPLISEIKVDKERLISNFKDINNIANVKMLKCIHLLFDKKKFFKNSANYMLIILLIMSLIALFVFIFYNKKKIEAFMNQILTDKILNKKDINIVYNTQNDIIEKNNRKININQKSVSNASEENIFTISKNKSVKGKKNKENLKTLEEKESKKKKKQNKNNDIKSNNNNVQMNSAINSTSNNLINKNNDNKTKGFKFNSKTKLKKKEKNKINDENKSKVSFKLENKSYTDSELNLLIYEEALLYDQRTYFQYYKSLLLTKHIFIFTFFHHKDYNSMAIKIYIFFFTFAINYTVSCMFYSDSTMHKIYVDEGSFDLTYQIPQMIYSLIISAVLKSLLNFLGLYEDNLISIKNEKEKVLKSKVKKEYKLIKLKIILFFIITYVLLYFFWIYLGCFCAVYKNTQIHLLQEVSSSFAISFITPIFVCLLPGLFRIPSLKNKEKNKKYIYNVSKIIQIF